MTEEAGGATERADSPGELRGGKGPIVNAPPIVLIVIAVLVAIQVAIQLGGPDWEIWSIGVFALIPVRFGGVGRIAMIEGSQYWSLITYAFLHGGWLHVLFNSLWLLIFGTPVARQFGTLRFLVITVVSAIGGALVMTAVYWGSSTPVVGASAGVSGLLAAAIPIIFGRPGLPLTFTELLRDRRAVIFMIIFLVMTLFSGVQVLPTFADGPQIAWEGHLGGFATGLLAYILVSRERVRRP